MTCQTGPGNSEESQASGGERFPAIDLTARLTRVRELLADYKTRASLDALDDGPPIPERILDAVAPVLYEISNRIGLIDEKWMSKSPREVEEFIVRELALNLVGDDLVDRCLVDRVSDLAFCIAENKRRKEPPQDRQSPEAG